MADPPSRAEDRGHASLSLRNSEHAPVCVVGGMSSICHAFERAFSTLGFRVQPQARVEIVLDAPRGFAIQTLYRMETAAKVVVVAWNSCPEHTEDLLELQPDALLSDEFFLRQDIENAFGNVLRLVCDGQRYTFAPGPRSLLSTREREVLRCVALGWDNRRIGQHLRICEQTVKNRLRTVYRKLGLQGRVHAALYYWQVGNQTTTQTPGCRRGAFQPRYLGTDIVAP